MLLSTEAIVLKSISYGDSSIISSILTKNYGKISIIAKGVKKNKSTSRVLLEPLTIVNINCYYKKQRKTQILKNIELLENIPNIRNDLDELNSAIQMLDIINHTLQDYEETGVIFRLLKSALLKLNERILSPKLLLGFFLIQLYIQLGYMPDFIDCSYCHAKVKNNLICNFCRNHYSLNMNSNQIEGIKLLIKTHINDIGKLNLLNNDILIINNYLYNYGMLFLHGFNNIKSLKVDKNG